MDADVTLTINGAAHALSLDTRVTLLDLLRERLHLTGSKKGCDHGQCGACTVLVDGRRANACLLLAVALEGCEVTTIEGLDGHPLQDAFIAHDAFQCGYCTPGQIVSAVGFLAEGGDNFTELANTTEQSDSGRIDLTAYVDYITEFSPVEPDSATRSIGIVDTTGAAPAAGRSACASSMGARAMR